MFGRTLAALSLAAFAALLPPSVSLAAERADSFTLYENHPSEEAAENLYADNRKVTVKAGDRPDVVPLKAKPPAPAQTANPTEKAEQASAKPAHPATAPAPAKKDAHAAPKAAVAKPHAAKVKAAAPQVPLRHADDIAEADDADVISDALAVSEDPASFLKDDDTTVLPTPRQAAAKGAVREKLKASEDTLKMKSDTVDFMGAVENSIRYFSVGVKKHFARYLTRSGKYMGMMKEILREHYLPEDLVFLALIESGFNTRAYSVASASGPWQFIRGTAVRYGLKVDKWVDERRDPIKSTHAAAQYLKDLYSMFGTWPLAMASYNAGEGNVARAVRRNDTLDFWELRRTRSLPGETKEYVPKFMAARIIAENPEQYGFFDIEYDQPFEFDEVEVTTCTDLKVVAKCCGVDVNVIKDLNPELIRGCTPPYLPVYKLRVPKGMRELFLDNYAMLSDGDKVVRIDPERSTSKYRVKKGDTLSKIARKHGVSIKELASANGLKTKSKLRIGILLKIPREETVFPIIIKPAPPVKQAEQKEAVEEPAQSDDAGKPEEAEETAQSEAEAEKAGAVEGAAPEAAVEEADEAADTDAKPVIVKAPAPKKTYKVRRGDTLTEIARKNGLTIRELAKLNDLSTRARLKIGQRLVVSAGTVKSISSRKKAEKPRSQTYRVRRGDTVNSIAKKFDVEERDVLRANSLRKSSIIRVGQRLKIPA